MGNLLSQSGGSILFQLGATGTPGIATTYDTVAVTGDLTLDGTNEITRMTGIDTTNGVYQLYSYTGSLTDNGAVLTYPFTNSGGVTVTGVVDWCWLDMTSEAGKVYLKMGQSPGGSPSGTLLQIR